MLSFSLRNGEAVRTDKQKMTDMSVVFFPLRFPTQTDDDVIYEQDIIRDPTSIKPWLTYIEYKQQSGSILEQAFVSANMLRHQCSGLV